MRMSDAALMVREFHRAAGHPQRGMTREQLRTLRSRLILEESGEVADAIMGRRVMDRLSALEAITIGPWRRAEVAKELADLLVVTYGAADVFSIPLDAVLIDVHKSNMTKDFSAAPRPDGKILKGSTYRPPNLDWV